MEEKLLRELDAKGRGTLSAAGEAGGGGHVILSAAGDTGETSHVILSAAVEAGGGGHVILSEAGEARGAEGSPSALDTAFDQVRDPSTPGAGAPSAQDDMAEAVRADCPAPGTPSQPHGAIRQPRRLGPGAIALIAIAVAWALLLLVLPLAYVLIQAFKDGPAAYLANVTDPFTVKATQLTVLAVVVSVAVNTVFGLFAAFTVTKFTFRGKKLLTTLIDLPLSISPVIAGLAFLLTFGRQGPLYDLLMDVNAPVIYAVPGVIIATVFVTFPFISRELIPVLLSQGADEEEAAALMGAGWWTVFWKVTFPHVKWALLYGVVLCAARAMGEFGAVSVISGSLRGITTTLPLQVEMLYNEFKFAPAFAASSILVCLAIVILIVRSVLEHRAGKKGRA